MTGRDNNLARDVGGLTYTDTIGSIGDVRG